MIENASTQQQKGERPVAYGKELRTALQAFRAGVKPALKTAKNDHFRSKYAPLDEVMEAFKDALHAAGLVVEQWTHESETATFLHTRIIHVETGDMTEESVCRLRIPSGRDDMPGLGSAQTYARRQQLLLAAMIAPEDDDGQSIMAAPPVKAAPAAPVNLEAEMSADTRAEIARLFRGLKMTVGEVDNVCKKAVGKGKPTEASPWTEGEGKKLVAELKKIEGAGS